LKAVVFDAPRRLSLQEVAEPVCADDEVVIRTRCAGLCGTDLHIFRDEYQSTFPLIPGHEFVGEVHQVGRNVESFSAGQRVTADPNLYCGDCDFCRRGRHNQCIHWEGVGINRSGAFAEYVSVPAAACYGIPQAMTDAEAAFIEPVSCVVHAMNRLGPAEGDTAVVFGAGPMGALLIQALRHRGAALLVAVDKQESRLSTARELGAGETIAAGPDLTRQLRRIAPRGFDVVVDATGVPEAISQGLETLGPYGRFLQFGVAPRHVAITLRPYDVFRNDWTILGSFALCYTFRQAIDWMASGAIQVEPLVSHCLPLEEFATAFDNFERGGTMKVQFRFDR
jgi:2-desacetyl-2-hydroxyethyl bacteriochlorophyllide A dehydrogenase